MYYKEEWLEEFSDSEGTFYNGNEIDNNDESYNENNEQQQLSQGFGSSCYKIDTPILLQTLINDFAVCKHYSGTLYLLKMSAKVWETRTRYFKKEPDFLTDQPRICYIFMLCRIKSIFLN